MTVHDWGHGGRHVSMNLVMTAETPPMPQSSSCATYTGISVHMVCGANKIWGADTIQHQAHCEAYDSWA